MFVQCNISQSLHLALLHGRACLSEFLRRPTNTTGGCDLLPLLWLRKYDVHFRSLRIFGGQTLLDLDLFDFGKSRADYQILFMFSWLTYQQWCKCFWELVLYKLLFAVNYQSYLIYFSTTFWARFVKPCHYVFEAQGLQASLSQSRRWFGIV
jgi:hypothetical protein